MCWGRRLPSSEKLANSEKSEKITTFREDYYISISTILYLINSQGETP